MKASIDALKSVAQGRTIAVLGDMLELGADEEALHKGIGEYAREKGVDFVWTFGKRATFICEGYGEGALNFEDKKRLGEHIIANIQPGDTIVFKASRSMRFEEIINQVYEK